MYTRNSVPIDESRSRQIYYRSARPSNWVGRLYDRIFHTVYWRWAMYKNFSEQDFKAVAPQRYDTPEHLSATDVHQIKWRRLVLTARGMLPPDEAEALPETAPEQFAREAEAAKRS